MFLSSSTLDDLLLRVYQNLLNSPHRSKGSRGALRERCGVLLQLMRPRARLSLTEKRGKVFSGLGELLWYLSKSNELDFIQYYIERYKDETEDGKTVYGGYGPRLFALRSVDQVANAIKALKKNASSKRVVIQLFDAADLDAPHKEVPCTCILHLFIRYNRLRLITYMRSNDAFLGLPHDIFAFTMLQELVARAIGVDVGRYKHMVGSLHLYERNVKAVEKYVNEGWQPTKNAEMPPMPLGDPWIAVQKVLGAENVLRGGKQIDVKDLKLTPYWADIVRLLQIYACLKHDRHTEIRKIKKQMVSNYYDACISRRQPPSEAVPAIPQREFRFPDSVKLRAK